MSQQFSKDAQFSSASFPPIPASGANTEMLRTNALTPPFGTCKAVVKTVLNVAPEAAATQLDLIVVRNPESDNLALLDMTLTVEAGAGQNLILDGMVTDAIPDGRDVVYSLQVSQSGGAGAGQCLVAFIEAELISG